MIDKLRELGYRIEFSNGPTSEEMKDLQRAGGWAWEGDTHAYHDGEPIQHDDPEGPGYIPKQHVLKDDSDEPTVWFIEGLSGYEHSDGTPIDVQFKLYVRDSDIATLKTIVNTHEDRVAELKQQTTETPDETAKRLSAKALETEV